MDIIESHRRGLVEQLESEAAALAGRARDSAQRAVVYHHVADMLGLAHGYALLAAHGALAIDPAVARIERRARLAMWRVPRDQRAALADRITVFGATLRALDAERCAGLLMAYRLVATPSLGSEAAERLDPDLFAALREAQSRRGEADASARHRLFEAHQRWAGGLIGARIEQAVEALEWPLSRRALSGAIDALQIPLATYERADRIGLARIERRLRGSKRLPEKFVANPAQAFFQLQRQTAERRRREADGGNLSADDAVRLAA